MPRNDLYVVAFNGPPKSGKDSVANSFVLQMTGNYRVASQKVQLSLPMRRTIFALLGLGEYTEAHYESIKDEVMSPSGWTVREMMINLSEKHIKPSYGKEYWIAVAMNGIKDSTKLAIISDLGFEEEIDYLLSRFMKHRVLVVQLEREGTTWGNDSRGSVTGYQTLVIKNNGTITQAAVRVRQHCKTLGWAVCNGIAA